jgi:hypothetical protein
MKSKLFLYICVFIINYGYSQSIFLKVNLTILADSSYNERDPIVLAYLLDVFILSEYSGKVYSRQLIKAIKAEPKLQSCKVRMLKTSDVHDFYKQFRYT